MKLFMIESEDGRDYVEANTFGDAVMKWRLAKLDEFGSVDEKGNPTGWDNESLPDTVAHLSDREVIR